MPKKTFFQLPDIKKEHILQAARDVLSKSNYQDTSVNTLIAAMGIPTGSFYQYFADKEDLYFYLMSIYMDGVAKEAQETGKRINLLAPSINQRGIQVFDKSVNVAGYQEIFVDNFNAAPASIKRDWIFEMLMQKYMSVYDFSFFEDESISPICRENKELLMSMFMTIPLLAGRCVSRKEDPLKYQQLYNLCLNVLRCGIKAYGTCEILE